MQRFLRAESTDDYAEMTLLFDAVIGIAQSTGATILLLHHASKMAREALDSVLGSTAITGSADTIMVLTRTERYRTFSTRQRVGTDIDEQVIELDETTGRVRLAGSREDADTRAVADALLAALANADGPLTQPEWFKAVEARKATKLKAFRLLEAGNQFVKDGPGTRNHPFRYSLTGLVSSSLVPSKEWELETRSQPSMEFAKDSAGNTSSHIYAQEDDDDRSQY
jgi:hypothetical protein